MNACLYRIEVREVTSDVTVLATPLRGVTNREVAMRQFGEVLACPTANGRRPYTPYGRHRLVLVQVTGPRVRYCDLPACLASSRRHERGPGCTAVVSIP